VGAEGDRHRGQHLQRRRAEHRALAAGRRVCRSDPANRRTARAGGCVSRLRRETPRAPTLADHERTHRRQGRRPGPHPAQPGKRDALVEALQEAIDNADTPRPAPCLHPAHRPGGPRRGSCSTSSTPTRRRSRRRQQRPVPGDRQDAAEVRRRPPGVDVPHPGHRQGPLTHPAPPVRPPVAGKPRSGPHRPDVAFLPRGVSGWPQTLLNGARRPRMWTRVPQV
jgi:hypothetical protein